MPSLDSATLLDLRRKQVRVVCVQLHVSPRQPDKSKRTDVVEPRFIHKPGCVLPVPGDWERVPVVRPARHRSRLRRRRGVPGGRGG